jgi:hypothetical protein
MSRAQIATSPFLKTDVEGGATDRRLAAEQNHKILKFERADWTLFRTVEGLQQKAGVPAKLLRRLVLKELGDNALDTGADILYGHTDGDLDRFYIEDNGPGLDGTPEEIASLFSISRPMRSSKLLRLPQRGALGNGLRVVAGAVLASQGSLVVITRNRRIVLRPESDGTTSVLEVTEAIRSVGTRIEIGFGSALPRDGSSLGWVKLAARSVAGTTYEGKSSPCWYDGAQFHELLLAGGAQPVRSLIAQLDGCSGGKAGEIITTAGLERKACNEVSRDQAVWLLRSARHHARPVNPKRLGGIGCDGLFGHAQMFCAVERGTVELGSVEPLAEIPFVIEAWARKEETVAEDGSKDNLDAIMLINRTPAVDGLSIWRDGDKDLWLRGCGLSDYTQNAPRKGSYFITINVTIPYCPITSDGKAPDLSAFADYILAAVAAAMRKARSAAPKDKKVDQIDVVLDNLDAAIAEVGGGYRFGERQLLYWLRPIVKRETGEDLKTSNFKRIITDYEAENGEIPGMYREPRGSIYHPHRQETLPLGTLMVEEYERPAWTFNKLVYIEKEGFSEALKEVGWGERHDCALISSKGFTTRAARDLIDKLAEHDEPVIVFCVTDADAPGGVIYQTLQEATKARGARKIKIIHLGLQPWEAIAAGLEIEEVEYKKRQAVADYVRAREDLAPNGQTWEEWLQKHRIELNALTTPQFIAWLDAKMAEHGNGKLVPPDDVVEDELEERLEAKVRNSIRERILREAGFEKQVADTLEAIELPSSVELIDGIKESFTRNPEDEWRKHIDGVADKLAEQDLDDEQSEE